MLDAMGLTSRPNPPKEEMKPEDVVQKGDGKSRNPEGTTATDPPENDSQDESQSGENKLCRCRGKERATKEEGGEAEFEEVRN